MEERILSFETNLTQMKQPSIIISGGGTGGHIFPAVAIANELKKQLPEATILFVGAKGKMEMERVPKAGYEIIGLPIKGFNRKRPLSFFSTVFMLLKSLRIAKNILKERKPNVVIGVGGYASAAVLYEATVKQIPTLIQEQNSYAGLTNKLLRNRVDRICVAYDNMERFFPRSKTVKTGNPVREDLRHFSVSKEEAYDYFKLNPKKKTVLVVGGSLGARTLNESLIKEHRLFSERDVQLIWQTGKYYYDGVLEKMGDKLPANIRLYKFLDRMDWAYSVADLVISRAGALSISELSLLRKPTILVPSPNVAEDHQTKNAMNLVEKDAAVFVADNQAEEKLLEQIEFLIFNDERLARLSENISSFACENATTDIVKEVLKIMK